MSATVTDFAEAAKGRLTVAGRVESLNRAKSGNLFLTIRHDRAKHVQSHIVIRRNQVPEGLQLGSTIQFFKTDGCLGFRHKENEKPIFYDFVDKPRVLRDGGQVLLGLFVQHQYLAGHPSSHVLS